MLFVRDRIRQLSSLELIADQWMDLYQRTIDEYSPSTAMLEQDFIAASAHLESLGRVIQQGRKYDNMSNFVRSFPRRIFAPIAKLFGGRRAA
jgi:hypothetical protein